MVFEDVIRAECEYVDESDMPEHLQQENRIKCDLRSQEIEETVFVDEWSFHDSSMVSSSMPHQDYDFVVTFPGDCEKKMVSGGSSLTCKQ